MPQKLPHSQLPLAAHLQQLGITVVICWWIRQVAKSYILHLLYLEWTQIQTHQKQKQYCTIHLKLHIDVVNMEYFNCFKYIYVLFSVRL